MSRGEGESLTVPKPRAVSLLSVYLAVKPVGKPDAGNRLVRFDERGWETERCRMAQATAPILDLYEGAAVKEYFGGLAILIAPGYGFRRAVKSRSREAVRRRRRT